MSEIIEITRTDVIEIAGESEQIIITQPASLERLEVAQQGPSGPQGPQGPQGLPGTTTWGGITDKPATFAPSAHTHAVEDVTGLQSWLNLKAPLASPTFTGTVGGITKSMVGLGNVDNTSDSAKPVSTVQAAAIATATAIHPFLLIGA